MTGFRIGADPQRWNHPIYLCEDHGNMKAFAEGCEDGEIRMKTIKNHTSEKVPVLMHLEMEQMQNLYVTLGNFLAKERSLPLDGQFEAQSKHLEDMKTIAFHALKITK